jgi:hypothetical protein
MVIWQMNQDQIGRACCRHRRWEIHTKC